MPQENVEVLRSSFEAWNRNDWETLMACHAPDVVAVPPAEWPEAETGTSRDTLRHQFERAKDLLRQPRPISSLDHRRSHHKTPLPASRPPRDAPRIRSVL